MIQPNEKLLPGNVVMYNHEDGDRAIKLSSYVIFEIATDKINQRSFSPIPLTPEVLTDWCGFRQFSGFYELNTNALIVMFPLNISGVLSIMDAGLDSINIKCPEHLHTLQNLIYFLSGEEMPVNIPNN